jgi:hypothetical protein
MKIIVILLTVVNALEPYSWEEFHFYAKANPTHFVRIVRDYNENFPCADCRKHFRKVTKGLIKWFPLKHIHTREESMIWSWLAHNKVNSHLNHTWYDWDKFQLS